jgi:hypothetical protein
VPCRLKIPKSLSEMASIDRASRSGDESNKLLWLDDRLFQNLASAVRRWTAPDTDRTLIRKETLRPGPIDDDGFDGRRQCIAFLKEPSFEERQTEETKVLGCDRDPWHHRLGLSRWEWRHLKPEIIEAVYVIGRAAVSESHIRDAG